MGKLVCNYLNILEAAQHGFDVTSYSEFINPQDYEFGLLRSHEYLMLGVLERKGTPWLYIAPMKGELDIGIFPAVLFAIKDVIIPSGMNLRFDCISPPSLEIVPEKLANVKNWYERYVDEEKAIVDLVGNEINRLRQT